MKAGELWLAEMIMIWNIKKETVGSEFISASSDQDSSGISSLF